jgi:hypothetical protein
MRHFRSIHVPHFPHFSPHIALVSLRDRFTANYGVITVTLTILVGLLMALTFLAIVTR